MGSSSLRTKVSPNQGTAQIKPLQPATVFIAAGDALGIDGQLPSSLTLPAAQQPAPQLKCTLLAGASCSWEKLPFKSLLL